MKAICPHCRTEYASPGVRCTSEGCQASGYHSIPQTWMKTSEDYFVRKGKQMDPLLGRMISDEYLLAGLLGEGGMGAVYLALQYPLEREVALKTVLNQSFGDVAYKRFMREAKALGDLDHPGIIKLFHFGIAKLDFSFPFMVMEYIRGGKWLDRFFQLERDRSGELSPELVCRIFDQILDALAAAHSINIIHRDIKPGNVLITGSGMDAKVKLLDFGLAKTMSQEAPPEVITRSLEAVGTPMYMAPEQAKSGENRKFDGRTDLYSVAVMMFHVLTGVLPFKGGTAIEILMQKSDASWDPTTLPEASDLSPEFKDFFRRALSPVLTDRPESAQKMASEFRRLMTSDTRATAMLNTGPRQIVRQGFDSPLQFHRPESSSGTARASSSGGEEKSGSCCTGMDDGFEGAGIARFWKWFVAAGIVLAAGGLGFLGWGLFGPGPSVPVRASVKVSQTRPAAGAVAAVEPAPKAATPGGAVPSSASVPAAKMTPEPHAAQAVQAGPEPSAAQATPDTAPIARDIAPPAPQAAAFKPFSFAVTVDPPTAQIFVDGRAVGTGTALVRLSAAPKDDVVRIKATDEDCETLVVRRNWTEIAARGKVTLKMECLPRN